ncbi:class I SAM-dependent methyltransferase [Edwardsiella tarda]|uniref:class I SAM-dependent methyltransferase n=1 Tax=Edwardsiella tarda TaxID=636 RepID=UPI00030158D8|nr:class I SAM-dependent methyltransferase [Edwardsiella tarda]SPW25566.1 Probable S-adenosylmethionine-dependent methyltransferase MSMEG_2350 [Edwardsiella tarda]
MGQLNHYAIAYQQIRALIRYPEALYQFLARQCTHHDRALDLGCGSGFSSARLQTYFSQVAGCDRDEALIALARQNYPQLTFDVAKAELFTPPQPVDLLTCATAFYWMDRPLMLSRMAQLLQPGGIFCAYRYEFPLVYGPLRDVVEYELATRWAPFRDRRLVDYDDTLELMQIQPNLQHSQRQLFPNILTLSVAQLATFFLSTSYVTRYMAEQGGPEYAKRLLALLSASGERDVRVNFDVTAFICRLRR